MENIFPEFFFWNLQFILNHGFMTATLVAVVTVLSKFQHYNFAAVLRDVMKF